MEDHYRVNLFYPFIDHITSELDERFSESNEPALLAAYLVPKSLKKLTEEREQRMVKWYHEDLPYPNTLEQEIECWRHKLHSEDGVLPASALETLKTTQMSFFPNIQCMLKIFLTLPVTTCECERSFSAMRRLKTWLRSLCDWHLWCLVKGSQDWRWCMFIKKLSWTRRESLDGGMPLATGGYS